MSDLSQEESLIKMRKLVLEAESLVLEAKKLANDHGFTFTIATSTYDGSTENWVTKREEEEYWQSSSQTC
jgi:hypothetical protein